MLRLTRRFTLASGVLAASLQLSLAVASAAPASASSRIGIEPAAGLRPRPLDQLTVVGAKGGAVVVLDGEGREYLRQKGAARVTFTVGGSLGRQTVKLLDGAGKTLDTLTFDVDAETRFEDASGRFGELFQMAVDTMTVRRRAGAPAGDTGGAGEGGHGVFGWRGRDYRLYVPWVLDQSNTSKGMAFFSAHIRDGVEVFRDSQKADGMIWSFISKDSGPGYWDTAYGHLGYAWHDGGALWVRQPNENHVEYEYVNMLYQAWKATGDDAWMGKSLDSAVRALEYSVTDPVRISKRFGLLKRPYTIDSWDFQVNDEYTVKDTINPTMTIHPGKTKFGVFFGDNTGYVQACARLGEMLEHAGRTADAAKVRARGADVMDKLTKLVWNGRFYRHFVDEDPSVKRNLGVDEAAQIAQGNAYSLNRGIPHEHATAILRTYMELRDKLPKGSPGEWYAIYPPFGRGFGSHNDRWQYMNGGVAGHAAGELARGAFAHGFEAYGVSVLERSADLAKRTDRKIHFAYTGAYPDVPQPSSFTPVSLASVANMDTSDQGAQGVLPWMDGEKGNDLRTLPAGTIKVGNVPFQTLDPTKNGRRAVVAVGRAGLPPVVEVPVGNKRAGAIYLLHTSSVGKDAERRRGAGDPVAAGLTIKYQDGTQRGLYLRRAQHVGGWWYPALKGPDAGVAWTGSNAKTPNVGLTWAAIENPLPDKPIASLVVQASVENVTYALAGVTLADRMPHHPPSLVSYGGPDNWAAANMTAALVEGLAGVRDADRGYQRAEVAPRFLAVKDVRGATVVARYPASKGYVAYGFAHDPAGSRVTMTLTGNAQDFKARVLLPPGAQPAGAKLDGKVTKAGTSSVEGSTYAEVDVPAGLHVIEVAYKPGATAAN